MEPVSGGSLDGLVRVGNGVEGVSDIWAQPKAVRSKLAIAPAKKWRISEPMPHNLGIIESLPNTQVYRRWETQIAFSATGQPVAVILGKHAYSEYFGYFDLLDAAHPISSGHKYQLVEYAVEWYASRFINSLFSGYVIA